jgi:choline kinase
MAKKTSLAEELKALGSELANAFKQAKSSKEFQALEKDITSGVKNVSASLIRSLRAASHSEETAKIKKRVGRVVKISKAKGEEEARKAAKVGLNKFNKAFNTLSEKLRKNKN